MNRCGAGSALGQRVQLTRGEKGTRRAHGWGRHHELPCLMTKRMLSKPKWKGSSTSSSSSMCRGPARRPHLSATGRGSLPLDSLLRQKHLRRCLRRATWIIFPHVKQINAICDATARLIALRIQLANLATVVRPMCNSDSEGASNNHKSA